MGRFINKKSKKMHRENRKILAWKNHFSIGIRHIGQENAKILSSFFISIKEFSKLFDDKLRKEILKNLIELDGIGETQIEAIDNFFSKQTNIKITKNLLNNLNILSYTTKSKNGVFSNKK